METLQCLSWRLSGAGRKGGGQRKREGPGLARIQPQSGTPLFPNAASYGNKGHAVCLLTTLQFHFPPTEQTVFSNKYCAKCCNSGGGKNTPNSTQRHTRCCSRAAFIKANANSCACKEYPVLHAVTTASQVSCSSALCPRGLQSQDKAWWQQGDHPSLCVTIYIIDR